MDPIYTSFFDRFALGLRSRLIKAFYGKSGAPDDAFEKIIAKFYGDSIHEFAGALPTRLSQKMGKGAKDLVAAIEQGNIPEMLGHLTLDELMVIANIVSASATRHVAKAIVVQRIWAQVGRHAFELMLKHEAFAEREHYLAMITALATSTKAGAHEYPDVLVGIYKQHLTTKGKELERDQPLEEEEKEDAMDVDDDKDESDRPSVEEPSTDLAFLYAPISASVTTTPTQAAAKIRRARH